MARTHFSTSLGSGDGLDLRVNRRKVDFATWFGLFSGFGLLFLAMWFGGRIESFLDLPSIMIVIGGTLAVTIMCYSVDEVFRAQAVIRKTLFRAEGDPRRAAMLMLRASDIARRRNILSLQEVVDDIHADPLAEKAITLVIDGTPAEEIELILKHDAEHTSQRHGSSAAILRKAAEVSPAMGLIGTLVGLVQMLGNLDDPSTIGPSMAIALLTTFYGAILATMFFSPLAAKLERNSVSESLIASIYLLGASSIARKENPRRLEMLLNAVLPPARRIKYFD
jgi:chemotaxis protein MotA